MVRIGKVCGEMSRGRENEKRWGVRTRGKIGDAVIKFILHM